MVCGIIFTKSRFKGIYINILVISHAILYVFPFISHSEKYDLFYLIFFSSLGIFTATLLISVYYLKSKQLKIKKFLEVNFYELKLFNSNKLLFFSYLGLVISLYAIYNSLMNVGGVEQMIFSTGMGREYLEARVNSENSGLLGLLVWLAPMSIAFIFINLLVEKNRKIALKKRVFFFLFLALLFFGYFSLTIRHNSITTFIILFICYSIFREISKRRIFLMLTLTTIIIVGFQAIRLGVLNDFSLESVLETRSSGVEHLDVSEEIVKKVDNSEYTYFSHVGDIFIFLIPRKFWVDKPKTSYLNREYFPDVARVNSEKAIGILGEGYSMGGYLGVFLLTLFFTLFMGLVQIKMDLNIISFKLILFMLTIAPLSYLGIRTGVFGKHLLSVLMMLLQVYTFLILSKIKFKNVTYR